MPTLNLKPTHKPVRQYYEALGAYAELGVRHEGAVKTAFHDLLAHCGHQFHWTLVPEWPFKTRDGANRSADGALIDQYRLVHGHWEAKDSDDDLDKEVQKKFDRGYPRENIIFQAPDRALLTQDGELVRDADLTDADALVDVLKLFFAYRPPAYEAWERAVAEFKERVPQLGQGLVDLIERERKTNKRFVQALDGFLEVCRQAINPNLSLEAVEEMLIQHMLTERLFRTVFRNPDFAHRNVIAREIEKVIAALTSESFSRKDFLGRLDRFYVAIEETAKTINDYSQKQSFLNTVYEQFFQGFSVKVADTHGIVYTPQPIVDFMVRSVEALLQREFGASLSDAGIHVLDPFVGTGNFIVRVMREIRKTALPPKYAEALHCNDVMLLPYYIASMNIEHEFYERVGRYEPFPGIVLCDTFDLVEGQTIGMFNAENTERAQRQIKAPIKVILGNPPYNAHQINENDNNKNRKYEVIDKRVKGTYAKDSKATLKAALSDPYVKAFRWASDRIGEEGIVAYVSNNSFIDEISFDGMRKHLAQDFDAIYVLDLGGNVRKNPKLSGTTHNVFGIQVGVSITLLVRRRGMPKRRQAQIFYARMGEFDKKEKKYQYLDEADYVEGVTWRKIRPNKKYTWLIDDLQQEYDTYLSMGSKEEKASAEVNETTIFDLFSVGMKSSRDVWVFSFSEEDLISHVETTIDEYNRQAIQWKMQGGRGKSLDDFLLYDLSKISWSSGLKSHLKQGTLVEFEMDKVRKAIYRPYSAKYLYFDNCLIDRRGQFSRIFPTPETEKENYIICVGGYGRKDFAVLMSCFIPDLNLYADPQQSFPFYIYDKDGTNRRENVTDWALGQFRQHYSDDGIGKWDVFHYVYAVLHHPEYRERYAANLKRSLPRLPFAPSFHPFAEAGRRLAHLHVHYEAQPEYPLEKIEDPDLPLDWRVEKMKWLDADKTTLRYNAFLTLGGIPPEAHRYRLGNRSALDWLVDQYRVKTDKRSGITSNPNRADDPSYIVRLLGQVTTVSVETIRIVEALPTLGLPEPGA